MRRMIPSALFLCFLVGTSLFVGPSKAKADPSLNVWAAEGWRIETSDDVIDTATAFYGEQYVQLGAYVNSGIVSGLTGAFVLPSGINETWGSDAPAFIDWNAPGSTLGFAATNSVGAGENFHFGASRLRTLVPITSAVDVTRAISDPVFTQDVVTRTVTATLNVPGGALSGYDILQVELSEWNQAEGISATVTDANIPGAFWGGNGSYAANAAGLSGAYEFVMEVEFTRSGPAGQTQIGDLYYKPGITVSYMNQTGWTGSTGSTVSQDFGGGLVATVFTAGVVDFSSQKNSNVTQLLMTPIATADNSAAAPEEITLVRVQRQTISGHMVHEFFVEVDGNNLVGGTVTTPGAGGNTYKMVPDDDRDLEFWCESTNAGDLAAFTAGEYIIKLEGADGIEQTYKVTLTGDFPDEFPTLDQPMGFATANPRPTISWNDPNDLNVNFALLEMWTGGYDEEEIELIPGTDLMSFTPSEDLNLGGAMMWVVFGSVVDGTVNAEEAGGPTGVQFLAGFATGTDSYMNVVPEPATLALLGLCGLTLIRRRRSA